MFKVTTTMQAIPPLPPQAPPVPNSSPLDEAQWQMLRDAQVRRKAVLKAAGVAKFSACTMLIMAGLGVMSLAMDHSIESVVIVVAITVMGLIELSGAKRIAAAVPSAARDLGFNQLALLALIVIYCVVQMVTFSARGSSFLVSPEFRQTMTQLPSLEAMGEKLDSLAPLLVCGFYGLVILLSVLFQGGLALYYFSRRKVIQSFLNETPEWVRRACKETQQG